MATGEQSAGDKVVAQINDVANVVGTLVPTVAAIGAMVRLIAKTVRPTDAQKAQPFADAIAEFDAQVGKLKTAVADFEKAKEQAAARQATNLQPTPQPPAQEPPQGNAVGAMTTSNTPLAGGPQGDASDR